MKCLIAAVVCALMGLGGPAAAQDYPTRPVRVVIAFSPSGAIDILGRFIADKLSQMWGQQVVVENRPGGSGNIGAAAAAAAQPDGYTLHFGAQTLATNVTLSPATAFDPVTSFDPIILVATSQEVFQVSAVTPFKSIAGGDRLRQGQSRQAELLFGRHRLDVASHHGVLHGRHRHQDAARALQPDVAGHNDLLSGRTEISFGPMGSSIANIRSGHMRALALSGPARSKLLPEVPTLTEVGVNMPEEFELVRLLRAEGHAQGDHRQGQCRYREGAGDARHAGARGPARLPLHRRPAGQARELRQCRDRQVAQAGTEGRV